MQVHSSSARIPARASARLRAGDVLQASSAQPHASAIDRTSLGVTECGMLHIDDAVLEIIARKVRSTDRLSLVRLASVNKRLRSVMAPIVQSHGYPSTGEALVRLTEKNPYLKSVTLLKCEALSIDDLTTLKKCHELEALDIVDCAELTDAHLAVIADLPKLLHLRLRKCPQITSEGMRHVGKLTQLQYLVLESLKLDDEGMAHLRGLTKLMHFTGPEKDNITDKTVEVLMQFSRLSSVSMPPQTFSQSAIDGLRAKLRPGATLRMDARLA